MKITPARLISLIGFGLVLVICGVIYIRERDLYSSTGPPNRAKSYGTGKFVSDIRIGWCNNEGKVIKGNPFTDSLTLTVFLQNFDGWLLQQGRTEPRILPAGFSQEELRNYLTLVELKKASRLSQEQQATLQSYSDGTGQRGGLLFDERRNVTGRNAAQNRVVSSFPHRCENSLTHLERR